MSGINIAIIGYGYWGPNLARNFAALGNAAVHTVCDNDAASLEKARKRLPLAALTSDYEDILKDGGIHAVCIATPALTHAELALRALQSGKHVLVEKPLAMTRSQCDRMIAEADKRGLVLMVDHTFAYSGAARKLAELSQTFGKLHYFDSVRINLGIVQSDVNVLWDLAVHDLSILFQLGVDSPRAVSAVGVSHFASGVIDTAYLTLHYDSAFIAHVHVSWLAPAKVRRTIVAGDRKMAIYDDTEAVEKVKVYDSGVDARLVDEEAKKRMQVEYRTGDMVAPKLDSTEALALVAEEFCNCITNKRRPLTAAVDGARIVHILEAADQSLRQDGARIALA